ncbi:ferritin-like domain-containing protein [Lactarius vividus]|nr:ferritin-like domain-containing protein [Lactarius vividus]
MSAVKQLPVPVRNSSKPGFSNGLAESLIHLLCGLLLPSSWNRKAGALRQGERRGILPLPLVEFQLKLLINGDQFQLSFSFLGCPPKTPTLLAVILGLEIEPFRSFSPSLPVPTMRSTFGIFFFTVLAGVAFSRPLPRDGAPSDVDILNFALTLEHLENAFYTEGLSRFTQKDFVNAGFPDWSYGRFKQIAAHEAAHVHFLEATLGDKATKPCTYKFPYDSPKSFVELSHVLETVGKYLIHEPTPTVSCYLFDKDYLLAAATVLSTEARHSAWVDSATRKGSAWSGPFDTPLGVNQAFTIASSFIASCPPTNPTLPATRFAALTLPDPASARPGSTTPISFTLPSNIDRSTKLYGAFLSGQEALIVPLSDDGKSVGVPDTLRGTVYLLVTTDADGVDDSKTIAGPALLEFSFNANLVSRSSHITYQLSLGFALQS